MDVFVVKNWEKRFEGAKTKTYNNKTTCSMPNKHGLGYRKLVKAKNGPAMFGAWCALLQVLSRHEIPRQGYCTDTGSVHGNPYTEEDLELVTDIPKKIFAELFPLVLRLGWVEVRTLKDSEGIVQSPLVSPKYPLNSDSDLDSDSNLTSRRFTPPTEIEVETYMSERGILSNHKTEAGKFVDHFTSNGWKVGGKSSMKDWKSAVRNWERRNSDQTQSPKLNLDTF